MNDSFRASGAVNDSFMTFRGARTGEWAVPPVLVQDTAAPAGERGAGRGSRAALGYWDGLNDSFRASGAVNDSFMTFRGSPAAASLAH
ncbi:hypothetical protein MUY14_29995 [Amycolatopsis sp. FBCC-B4732]|uniref:hypothetical protein n=1 Tax=Amycolatopsis sp. FBCC-B4732 TaxID=3079339 RepID=UPI001FF30F3B|nr:hypothetical protein [Amycolatopsis sp. FBCC-B4732]UOX85990.1 hypothetical protein MUY14_29995 [Amycolatopsis sp. FBCC-B4732]